MSILSFICCECRIGDDKTRFATPFPNGKMHLGQDNAKVKPESESLQHCENPMPQHR